MKYEMIIDDMTWSYSRIGAFDQCPYKFLLKYIHKEQESNRFFSEFGSFMHELIASYLNGDASPDELRAICLKEFRRNVLSKAPSDKVFQTYLKDGLAYFEHMSEDFDGLSIVDVEKKFSFDFGGHKMVAIVDAIGRTKDGDLFIMDHKSHKLKPRGKKRRKSDDELDEYLRQLYLYSIPVESKYSERPKFLIFNCFRNEKNRQIVERFDDDVFEEVKKWAESSIARIRGEDEWEPDAEFWKCRHICGMDTCEFKDGEG